MKKSWLLIVPIVSILAVLSAWLLYPKQPFNTADNPTRSNNNCQNPAPVTFTYAPLDLKDTGYIIPMGRTSGEHVTPTDHTYFAPATFNTSTTHYPVYAPADGVINHVEWVQEPGDFRLIINHSCDVSTIFIHLNKLAEPIASQSKELSLQQKNVRVDVPVKAGDILGYIGGETFDFSAHDTTITLPGYVNPSRYAKDEPWRIHTVDPFNYFTPALAQQLKAKTIRTTPPIAGKIDHDIAGTLQGVWFLAAVKDYGKAERLSDYWQSHLTIAPHHLDPSQYIFSIGDYQGKPAALAINNAALSPNKITPTSGPVKYELQHFDLINNTTGQSWNRRSYAKSISVAPDQTQATVLLQLINNTTLKLEIFPGRSPAQVTNFTSGARTYER